MPKCIYLFHGKGGSPNGSVRLLESTLRPLLPNFDFRRPQLLHHDPEILAEVSLAALPRLNIPDSSIIIGISLGGLIAARFQETLRDDLTVVCVSSPTWADGVRLQRAMPDRLALYSSNDEGIAGRTSAWPSLAEAHDIPTLTHDTDRHVERLAPLITAFLNKTENR
jgi:pimeloyl-ACP methyl ester carboxylesterase